MGIGISIFLIAVGAVLAFAVHVFAQGVNTVAIGYILMVVGGVGLLAALLITGVGSRGGMRRSTVVDDGVSARRVDTYVN